MPIYTKKSESFFTPGPLRRWGNLKERFTSSYNGKLTVGLQGRVVLSRLGRLGSQVFVSKKGWPGVSANGGNLYHDRPRAAFWNRRLWAILGCFANDILVFLVTTMFVEEFCLPGTILLRKTYHFSSDLMIQMGAYDIFGVDSGANFLGVKFHEKISATLTTHQVVFRIHRNHVI